jgi:methionyl-tRNA synthetase
MNERSTRAALGAAKDPAQERRLWEVCSDSMHAFRLLTLLLAPILPATAERAAAMLGIPLPLRWSQLHEEPSLSIKPYEHLMQRVDARQVDALFDLEKEPANVTTSNAAPSSPRPPAPAAESRRISIDDFNRLDLRVAASSAPRPWRAPTVCCAPLVSEAKRTVFAGIRATYDAAQLGRLTVMVANLEPRKMRFGVSRAWCSPPVPTAADRSADARWRPSRHEVK